MILLYFHIHFHKRIKITPQKDIFICFSYWVRFNHFNIHQNRQKQNIKKGLKNIVILCNIWFIQIHIYLLLWLFLCHATFGLKISIGLRHFLSCFFFKGTIMEADEIHNSTNDPYARPLQNGESTSSSSNAGKRVFILTKTFHLKQIKEILKLILNYFHLM